MKNRTSHLLLALSFTLVVVGLTFGFIAINNYGNLGYNLLTGAVTTSAGGQANITINQVTALTNRVFTIDFGSGYVISGTECRIATNGQHNQTGSNCQSFTNVTNGFYLENTGNLNLSVNYSCSGNCTAALFLGGTSPAFQIRAKGAFFRNQSAQSNDTGPSCNTFTDTSGTIGNFGGWNISGTNPEGYYVAVGTGAYICGNASHFPLSPISTIDAAVIDINISIPEDAPATSYISSANFTFTAESTQ